MNKGKWPAKCQSKEMRMSKLGAITTLTVATVLVGCVDPSDFESEPVQVQTAQGTVTCQLYTDERVLWDEAIAAPAGMSISTADSICRAEGQRRKDQ